jgi:hypothetical protein
MVKRSKPENTLKRSGAARSPNGRAKSPARSERRAKRAGGDDRAGADRAGAAALRDVQHRFAAVVMRPLTDDWMTQPVWIDGRPTEEVAGEFIKPNDRLTSLERLEIYNRQYWFRLIDVMYEDYPGLGAILGDRRFHAFCKGYLLAHPSRSGLLRNLGRHLETFVAANPDLTAPQTDMALDMVRFEWAQVEAFDGAEKRPLKPPDMEGRDPSVTRLALQPYLTLLHLRYAVDKLAIAVKRQSLRSEASNASDGAEHVFRRRRSARKEEVFLVMHRAQNRVYAKRIAPDALAILSSLRAGKTIAEAVSQAIESSQSPTTDWPMVIQDWFATWMNFGWFCR